LIGEIEIHAADVFDTDDPKDDKAIFRFANRLHINTRIKAIRRELLFREGDPYRGRVLAETERHLRSIGLFYDARVMPVRYADGRVDVRVYTRDVWSLILGFGFSRSGGENEYRIGIQEANLLGWGKSIQLEYRKDIDRSSNILRYSDPNMAGTRLQLDLRYQDNSDGFLRHIGFGRPFYSLDTRHSAGGTAFDFDRVDRLYTLGEVRERFRHQEEFVEAGAGFSRGLKGRTVRRWGSGLTYNSHRFADEPGYPPAQELPEDRKLVYPWVSFWLVREGYVKLRNFDRIQRTEDFNFGSEFEVRLGFCNEVFGADRDQLILGSVYTGGFSLGQNRILLAEAHGAGRIGRDETENVLVGGSARYFHPTFAKHQIHFGLNLDVAHNLDGEKQLLLGGDSGLRGYPIRYQEGDRRWLFSVEHRFYTGWHVLRLARVGAAVFFDAGAAWFAGSRGDEFELGVLKDVGFGARVQSTRSSGQSMLHIDLAFPLDGDDTIDRVQLLIKARDRF
jgi:outer membrane protein assembly factor BamA